MRINRVYTRVGDDGKTALIGGDRVSKAHLRIDSYGTVDEFNAILGLVVTSFESDKMKERLEPVIQRIQNECFNLGCQLATPVIDKQSSMPRIEQRHIDALEKEIDSFNEGLPELTSFVLPGGGKVSSFLHLARTVCRRAERQVVLLMQEEEVGEFVLEYLNRLSDLLFVLSRYTAFETGHKELLWQSKTT